MKANLIVLCLAIVPLVVSCRISAHHQYTSTSTTSKINNEEHTKTFINNNGREECSYTFKTTGYGYRFKSNGPLRINSGTVEELRHGQVVDLVITEEDREYRYTISNGVTGIQFNNADGSITEADQARIRRAAEAVQKQLSENQQQVKAAKKQAEDAQKQAEATQAQLQRQAQALQKQAEAFQKQAEKQAEAMRKQAQALQKQAEEMQRQMIK